MSQEPVAENGATEARKPPYVPFSTFQNFIERLGKSGVPAIIDRRFIGGSGTNQSQMSMTLSVLDLIDSESKPSQELHDLAEQEDERAANYRKLVERHYSGAVALGHRATQSQLDAWFRQRGVNGDTARKAQSFFLALAKAAGMETSPHFKPTRAAANPKKRTTTRRKVDEPLAPTQATHVPSQPPGERRIHPAVTHLLDRIPEPGTPWSRAERDLFVETFGNLLDLFHPFTSDGAERAPQT